MVTCDDWSRAYVVVRVAELVHAQLPAHRLPQRVKRYMALHGVTWRHVSLRVVTSEARLPQRVERVREQRAPLLAVLVHQGEEGGDAVLRT